MRNVQFTKKLRGQKLDEREQRKLADASCLGGISRTTRSAAKLPEALLVGSKVRKVLAKFFSDFFMLFDGEKHVRGFESFWSLRGFLKLHHFRFAMHSRRSIKTVVVVHIPDKIIYTFQSQFDFICCVLLFNLCSLSSKTIAESKYK